MTRRRFWRLIPFAFFFVLIGCFQNMTLDKSVPRITKEELKSILGNPEVIVVDVRLSDEWKKSEWKIKGAVREDPEKFKSWADHYPRDETLVFY
jgi:3-mercaptopyruvate sulfurtransferase SseA